MQTYIEKVVRGEDLTLEEMEAAARLMFDTDTDPVLVGSFLVALKQKKESVDEITALVQVVREHALTMPGELIGAMDNCGTGGDQSNSFNISTASAFVVAGAGITVAKHGNRSISSKTGSADVLEALGVDIRQSPEVSYQLLKENQISFLFSQQMHPKMKPVVQVRRALKIPTIFNLIGPLTNPVELETQLIGIYRRDLLLDMASVLAKLGRKRALVINGPGFMDEASLAGETHCVLLDRGELLEFTIKPEDVDLPYVDNKAISGGDKEMNARILTDVLSGKHGPHRDTVLLNAGLAIFANGKATTIKEGIALARTSIDEGHALEKLNHLIQTHQREVR